jgi:hypothetical protein
MIGMTWMTLLASKAKPTTLLSWTKSKATYAVVSTLILVPFDYLLRGVLTIGTRKAATLLLADDYDDGWTGTIFRGTLYATAYCLFWTATCLYIRTVVVAVPGAWTVLLFFQVLI